jgi:hypothetical protein
MINNDNIATIAALQMRVDELCVSMLAHSKMIAELEEWLEALWERTGDDMVQDGCIGKSRHQHDIVVEILAKFSNLKIHHGLIESEES